jgi:hypothetical protein
LTGVFKAIEKWASQSDSRVRLLIILVWVFFAVLVVTSTLIAALIMLPSDWQLS